MKIHYKTVTDTIFEAGEKAQMAGRTIRFIELTDHEWVELASEQKSLTGLHLHRPKECEESPTLFGISLR